MTDSLSRRRFSVSDHRRVRALLLLLFCLSGWGFVKPLVASPDTSTTSAADGDAHAERLADDPRMVRWRQTFFLGIVLLFVFLVAAAALIHFSMRYRTFLLRKSQAPTPSEDVWRMHKPPENFDLPDEADDDDDDDA